MIPRYGDRMNMTKHTMHILVLAMLLLLVAGPRAAISVEAFSAASKPDNIATPAAYTDHAAIYVDGNADFLAQATAESWAGNGSPENPVTITGYRITDTGVAAVRIWNVDLHWVLSDCLIEGGPPYAAAVWLSNVSNGVISGNIMRNRDLGINAVDGTRNCSIIGNEICDNDRQGIVSLNGMSNCVISGNYFHGNQGNNIWMTGGFNDSEISDNTFIQGGNGIRVLACLRSTLRNNTVTDSQLDSIVIPSAHDTAILDNKVTGSLVTGIMTTGDELEIADNVVSDCVSYGIYLAFGNNCSLRENAVSSCTEYGLRLASVADATVTQNLFSDNGDGCQVVDDGDDNVFSYNYFNEWTSPDTDGNNIVDNPYEIDGDAGNSDPCPLADPEGPIPDDTATTTDGATSTGQGLDALSYLAIGFMVVLLGIAGYLKKRR
jgi:parallel beta-helix repeat protein